MRGSRLLPAVISMLILAAALTPASASDESVAAVPQSLIDSMTPLGYSLDDIAAAYGLSLRFGSSPEELRKPRSI